MNYENPKSEHVQDRPGKSTGAGVQSGLSECMAIEDQDMAQKTKGPDQKPCPTSGSAGSRHGKKFVWK